MKKIHLIITVIFISSYSCKAQKNKLTRTEYYNIKINNVTFQSLYDTNGDEASMKALFGSDLEFEANTTGPSLGRDFWNGSIYLNFEDDSDTGSYYVPTLINIKNSSVTITVKGISVKLGDDKSVFGSLFVFKSINSIIFVSETSTLKILYTRT